MNILISHKDYPPVVSDKTKTFVEGFIPFVAEMYGVFCGRLFQTLINKFGEDVFDINKVEFDIIHDKFSTTWHPPDKEAFFISIYNNSAIGWPGCNIAIFYPNPSEKHPFAMAKSSFYYIDDFIQDLKERI